jgi:hypothetical protein
MEQSFNNETFNDFGDKSPIGGDMNLQMEQNMLMDQTQLNTPYESMSITEIIKKFNFQIFFKDEIQPNFTQVYVHNKFHKFYLAKNPTIGPLSIIILNDVANKKSTFAKLLEKLSTMNDTNSKYILKLKGIVNIDDKQVYLVFDPVLSSYRNKYKAKLVDLNFKYITIFYMVELVHQCHAKNVGLETMRPSTLLYNNLDELRYLIPYSINILF